MTGRLFLQYPPAELSQFLWVSHDSADIGVVVILPSGEGFCFAAYPKIELPEVSRIVRRMLSCSAPAFHWHLGQPGVTACQKSFCAETQNPSESYNRQRVLFCHFSPPKNSSQNARGCIRLHAAWLHTETHARGRFFSKTMFTLSHMFNCELTILRVHRQANS